MIVISTVLMLAGGVFLVVSAIGLARLPEVYTRAHAVAKSETLGLMLVGAGLLFRPELDTATAIRLIAIIVFSVIANPTAVHGLVRAARRDGVPSWRSARLTVQPAGPVTRPVAGDVDAPAPDDRDGPAGDPTDGEGTT